MWLSSAQSDLLCVQALADIRNLSTVDVAAVRLWLDRRVQPKTPSNVMAGFDQGVGATFFDLNALQVCPILTISLVSGPHFALILMIFNEVCCSQAVSLMP